MRSIEKTCVPTGNLRTGYKNGGHSALRTGLHMLHIRLATKPTKSNASQNIFILFFNCHGHQPRPKTGKRMEEKKPKKHTPSDRLPGSRPALSSPRTPSSTVEGTEQIVAVPRPPHPSHPVPSHPIPSRPIHPPTQPSVCTPSVCVGFGQSGRRDWRTGVPVAKRRERPSATLCARPGPFSLGSRT